MMGRRTAIGLLAGVLLAGLIAVPGAPAGAQDIADLPRLGYEINPTQGFVGDEVHSQVNPADVSEHCWDPELAGLTFGELVGLWVGGEITDQQFLDTPMMEIVSYTAPGFAYYFFIGGSPETQEAWEAKYGWVPADGDDNPIRNFVVDRAQQPPPEGIPDDQAGANFLNFTRAAFTTALGGLGIEAVALALYSELHVTTFVDPATQELLGETGNFDPVTGEGTMLVPELDPALYAVVAACVFFGSPEHFMAHWDEALVAAWDYGVTCEEEGGEFCFPAGGGSAGWQDWATEGGFGALLPPLLAPRAVGIDFYCILQPDGFCATPPGPVGLIDDDVLDEFNGDGPGDDLPGPGTEDLDDAGDLVAVDATPSFTG